MTMNAVALKKFLGYEHDINRLILQPLKAALVMGAVVGIIFWVPYKLLPGVFDRYLMSAVLTMVSVLIGVIVYAIIYTKSTGMTDAEIRRLPMGTKILVLLRKLHVR